jgi:hypothetical protein
MSRSYYDKVNKYYKQYTNDYRQTITWYDNDVEKICKLILEIIYDKNDDEFDIFYTNHMSKFKLKQYYFTRLFNPSYTYIRNVNFNSFDNVNDFIDKACTVIQDSNFYKELNTFLTEILEINQRIEKEKLEESRIKALVKEVIKDEKQTKTKNDNKTDDKDKKKKKKPISATIKRLVWNTHIGEEVGKAKCICCKATDITQLSFNCGHIIAEANGGETIVSNLKPICQNCNSSMGTNNMEYFMKSLK